jgi:dienelactone hydrolase
VRALSLRHTAPGALAAAALLLACACSMMRPAAAPRDVGWRLAAPATPVPGNPDLCEDRREVSRAPHGAWDRIALRQLARCDDTRETAERATQVFYLPGTHMNGSLALRDERHEFRLYLARRGVVVWSLDYRTHFVPPESEGLEFMGGWTWQVFLDDAAAALEVVRRESTGPVVVAGFSLGASFASALATGSPPPTAGEDPGAAPGDENAQGHALAGLVLLDGVAPGMLPSASVSRPVSVAIDVASSRLPFARRQALLAAVLANAHAPSANAEFPTVGHELAYLLYTSATFGGRGGLSDALHGRADIADVARLLASYDRFWPGAATRAGAAASAPAEPSPEAASGSAPATLTAPGALDSPAPSSPEHSAAATAATDSPASPALATLPVFAVASTNMGEGFRNAVEASARRLGGTGATIVVLPGWGHLDVLVGASARDQVFAPLLDWLP